MRGPSLGSALSLVEGRHLVSLLVRGNLSYASRLLYFLAMPSLWFGIYRLSCSLGLFVAASWPLGLPGAGSTHMLLCFWFCAIGAYIWFLLAFLLLMMLSWDWCATLLFQYPLAVRAECPVFAGVCSLAVEIHLYIRIHALFALTACELLLAGRERLKVDWWWLPFISIVQLRVLLCLLRSLLGSFFAFRLWWLFILHLTIRIV